MWKRCRSTAKRYPGDNRLILPKSPYRRQSLAPRCRLVASWGWSRSQGLGCSPIKAVRELGLERRETVNEPRCPKIWLYAGNSGASCGTSRCHVLVRGLTSTVTIQQVGDPSDRAGQSAGKARRLFGGSRLVVQNPQRPYARHAQRFLCMKRWSDPHGDMGSQAEQKRPGRRSSIRIGGNRCVGPYPPWA
jgi:hypothetical protein